MGFMPSNIYFQLFLGGRGVLSLRAYICVVEIRVKFSILRFIMIYMTYFKLKGPFSNFLTQKQIFTKNTSNIYENAFSKRVLEIFFKLLTRFRVKTSNRLIANKQKKRIWDISVGDPDPDLFAGSSSGSIIWFRIQLW